MRTFTCRHCSEKFTPDAEEQKSIDAGVYYHLPNNGIEF